MVRQLPSRNRSRFRILTWSAAKDRPLVSNVAAAPIAIMVVNTRFILTTSTRPLLGLGVPTTPLNDMYKLRLEFVTNEIKRVNCR